MSGGLASLRVLIVDEKKHLKQILPPVLAGAGIQAFAFSTGGDSALTALQQHKPHMVFIDYDDSPEEVLAFVREARRSPKLWDCKAPIIILSSQLSHDDIRAARDAGVNEILAKPITIASVMNRLSRVILKPRPFVTSRGYVGPDRRRPGEGGYPGPLRRLADRSRRTLPGG